MLTLSAPLLKLVEVVDSTYAVAHQRATEASTTSNGHPSGTNDRQRGFCALLAQTEETLALMANKLIFLLIKVITYLPYVISR